MNAVTLTKAPPQASTVSTATVWGPGGADDFDEARASGSARVVWFVALFLLAFFVWAWFFEIDEVSSGMGKVIPSSREQRIQSLEGGILAELRVHEGQIVEKGQVLAQLDPTRGESNVEETAARYRAALASSARLRQGAAASRETAASAGRGKEGQA